MDNNGFFYNTLPQNTQNFDAVLSGVGRSLREIGRSTQYLPYDIVGAPVDLTTLLLRPLGYNVQAPVGGSDWLIELARKYGIADKPTGSGLETLTRIAVGAPSPVAVPRAAAKVGQMLERTGEITTEQANRAADALVRQITGNPQATAPQVLQETAMPFMQAVAPKAPGLLESPAKSPLGFYSALEEATIPLQNKGTGQQYLAQIEKTAGVKPEEIKWTGLDDFLQSRQNVTKQEIQDYLAANRVDVQEVRLGGELPVGWNVQQNPRTGLFDAIDPQGNVMGVGQNRAEAIADASAEIVSSGMPTLAPTKFSQYTLPGGENYREILLTLPRKDALSPAEKSEKWFLESQKRYGNLSQEEIARLEQLEARSAQKDFGSSHFDQPNILAHMRVNDRIVDGKKTLFIEEVQSDWHQAGRKKGYKGNLEEQNKEIAELKAKFGDLQGGAFSEFNPDKNTFDVFDSFANYKGTFNTQEEATLFVNEANAARNRLIELERNQQSAVPDAPFKTSWHELTLKRAIQEASEKGYDKIAFTTGKTQAERYDLSQQVRNINVESVPEAPGVQFVDVYTNNGKTIFLEIENGVIREGQFAGKQLDEVVGKELSQHITSLPAGEKIKIEGDDLSIGGQGMKGFYDNILPKSLEKLGKKFDARVGKTTMDGVEVWSMDITPKMRESVLTKGQPLFAATPAVPLGLLGGDEGE